MSTIKAARVDSFIREASAALLASADYTDTDSARLDVELILVKGINKSRSFFYAHPEFIIEVKLLSALWALVKRRAEGIPLAYLLGQKEFWSLSLTVDERVLIPRPETEDMIEAVLQLSLPDEACVVDLGTGSGAIALALATEREEWLVLAVEYASAAAEVALDNIRCHQNKQQQPLQAGRPGLIQADWLSACRPACFDLVVANPPYIAGDDAHLQQGDVRFEPLSALVSADRGFADITCIASQANYCLKRGGYLAIEHGYDQGETVVGIVQAAGFHDVISHKDLAGHARFVLAVKP